MAKKRKQPTKPRAKKTTVRSDATKKLARDGDKAVAGAARNPIEMVLLVLAGLGVLLTAYLCYVHWFGDHPAYCTAGSDCDAVQSSRYSTLFTLPLAFWGLLCYLVMFRYIHKMHAKPSAWKMAFTVSLVALAISIYLTGVSVFAIEAVCMYCLVSLALIAAIFLLLVLRKPTHAVYPWSGALPSAGIAAALVVAFLHLHWGGLFDAKAGPEKPALSALATHLDDSGAVFYGAYWCIRCEEQKKLFGASVKRLPYVECSPEGQNAPPSTTCLVKSINNYPTWIIDDKRYTGVQSIEALTELSGFVPPKVN